MANCAARKSVRNDLVFVVTFRTEGLSKGITVKAAEEYADTYQLRLS